MPKLLLADIGRDFNSCFESAPGEGTGRLSLNILCGVALRFQYILGPAWPTARAALSHAQERRDAEEYISSTCIPCPLLSLRGPPCAPSTVITIVSRAVHVCFCSASHYAAAVQESLENKTEMQTNSLYFPFRLRLSFPQTLRKGPALQQIALPWRTQGQVNNIIVALEKCHWQLEKVRNFTP